MAIIKFTSEEKEQIGRRVQRYVSEELGQDIGQFDAEFLVDFFAEEIGAFFYNRGLMDAQAVVESRLADTVEAIYEIEKPTPFTR